MNQENKLPTPEEFLELNYIRLHEETKPGQTYPTPLPGWVAEEVKKYMSQVVEYTLKRAAEEAEAIEGDGGFFSFAASVDKQSILSLLPTIKKELGL